MRLEEIFNFEQIKDDFLMAVGFYVADLVDGVIRKFAGKWVAGFEDVVTYLAISYFSKKVDNETIKKILTGARITQFKNVLEKYIPQIGETIRGLGAKLTGE